MKKILHILLMLFSSINILAQITAIPDPNFEQALIDLGYDTTLNGSVPTANINTITTLIVSGKNISDLTGIEDFVALANLNCSSNQLTNLNVSQNTAIKILTCDNNFLTCLDLSLNTALVNLSCNSNQLTSLDVSQNIALEGLSCNNNLIKSLHLVQNTALNNLRCQNNQLSYLNVKNGNNTNLNIFTAYGNPNLACIEVDNIAYSTTNWTSIDAASSFSENCSQQAFVYVPDDNFEQALIDLGYDCFLDDFVPAVNVNTITQLDVSNKSIFDFTGINSFTALEDLDISSNPISQSITFNINNLTALTTLNCSGSQLTSLDVTQNTVLETLVCLNNQLTSLDVMQNTALIYLDCDNNLLTSLDVKNGNNINFTLFDATNNPNLTCIEVDDADYSTTSWTNIDTTASFSEDCSTLGTEDLLANTEKLIVTNYNGASIKVETKNGSIIKSFRAYNILGKIIINTKPNQSEFFIDTQYSRHGTILFIKAELENSYVLYRKFLKI